MTGQAFSPEPELIQGGMGVAISGWQLARSVAETGERIGRPVLGVVSGTGLAITMVLRLRKGDSNTRRALEAFPVPEIAQGVIERYWLNTDRSSRSRIPPKPEILVNGSDERKADFAKLLIVANFAEVWLARQGHSGPVGINYLEKVQLPRLPEIFGAMLGGVDYVLMGAGIPNQVPGVLDDLAGWKEASYKIDVTGSEKYVLSFDPKTIIPEQYRMPLTRPKFLAIVRITCSHRPSLSRLRERWMALWWKARLQVGITLRPGEKRSAKAGSRSTGSATSRTWRRYGT